MHFSVAMLVEQKQHLTNESRENNIVGVRCRRPPKIITDLGRVQTCPQNTNHAQTH